MNLYNSTATLRLLISEPALPHVSMDRDAELLRRLSDVNVEDATSSVCARAPVLHYYDWSVPSLTYGYFARPDALLHLDQLARHGWHAARRPTGGGVIFHFTDFAFSLLIPCPHSSLSLNPLANYAWINGIVLQAIQPFLPRGMRGDLVQKKEDHQIERVEIAKLRPTFCMAESSHYDLIVDGKKIGGAAQRQTRHGLLHQGSLYLTDPPFEMIQEVVQNGEHIVRSMKETSAPLVKGSLSAEALHTLRTELRCVLYETFNKVF